MEQEKVPNNIAKYRKKKKWTQQQLSQATGYTQGQICRWEKGATLSIMSATLISKALGITIDELIETSPYAEV